MVSSCGEIFKVIICFIIYIFLGYRKNPVCKEQNSEAADQFNDPNFKALEHAYILTFLSVYIRFRFKT